MPAVSSSCARGVRQSTCGENFVLGWLILKCVRGTQGVQHIGKFLVANYEEMVDDFPAFCTHLIQHGEELCASTGRPFWLIAKDFIVRYQACVSCERSATSHAVPRF